MVEISRHKGPVRRRLPLHALFAGLLLVLWNGFGLALAASAQTGQIPGLDTVSQTYFESQPLWFVLFADLGPLSGLAGSVAILLQHKVAVKLFAAQFAVIFLANIYEIALGISLFQVADAPIAPTLVTYAIMGLQIAYATWLARRGDLY